MREYYYRVEGRKVGPVSRQELRRLARQGRIRRHTLVWTEGMVDWCPVHLVPDLFPEEIPTVELAEDLAAVPTVEPLEDEPGYQGAARRAAETFQEKASQWTGWQIGTGVILAALGILVALVFLVALASLGQGGGGGGNDDRWQRVFNDMVDG